MERFINIAVIHFMATALSLLGFGALEGGESSGLQLVFKSVLRVITVPARQLARVLLPDGGAAIWLFYIVNSLLWAAVLTQAWILIEKRRGQAGAD